MSSQNLPQSPESPLSSEQSSDPGRKPRVAVVFGGRSSEHGISVVTAGAIMSAIDRTKYDVLPIGITRDGRWALTSDDPARMAITDRQVPDVDQLADSARGAVTLSVDPGNRDVVVSEPGSVPTVLGEVDVVFPMLHGPYGEDGTLQGLLELSGVPYVGAGVLSSAVGQDKEYMKRVFTSFGLPVGPYEVVRPREWESDRPAARKRIMEFAAEHGWPLFVKPARGGSSMGITKVDDPSGLDEAIEEARRHDPKFLVESLLRGREIECGVLEFEDGPRASVPAEIPPVTAHDFYDFEAKYIDSAAGLVPAPLTEEQTAEVQPARRRRLRGGLLRGPRARRLLPHGGRLVRHQRDQHHAGLHPDLHVPPHVAGERCGVPGARGPADHGRAEPLHRPALSPEP